MYRGFIGKGFGIETNPSLHRMGVVPSGSPTEEILHTVAEFLQLGDILIDGGNTLYKDDVRRATELHQKGIHYVDVGTSGGMWGLKVGYCLMVGGEERIVEQLQPIFKTLAPEKGWAYMGTHGAGHYVKMIHNGIEYSMMQGYAEGFELMSKSEYNLDLAKIADLWMHGSVVRSWLLELAAGVLSKDPKLQHLKGYVQDSGEGRWTLLDALEKDVPVWTISAVFSRFIYPVPLPPRRLPLLRSSWRDCGMHLGVTALNENNEKEGKL